MKRWGRRLLIAASIAVGVIALATVIYLAYLFFTVVLPMIPALIYSFLK